MPNYHLQEFDSADRAIIERLQVDGRISTAELGRAISLSPSATADRIRRLTDLGVIAGYTAVVDPESSASPLPRSFASPIHRATTNRSTM